MHGPTQASFLPFVVFQKTELNGPVHQRQYSRQNQIEIKWTVINPHRVCWYCEGCFLKMGHSQSLYRLFVVFFKQTAQLLQQFKWQMPVQYPLLGFEPTTSWTRVSSHKLLRWILLDGKMLTLFGPKNWMLSSLWTDGCLAPIGSTLHPFWHHR